MGVKRTVGSAKMFGVGPFEKCSTKEVYIEKKDCGCCLLRRG